MEYLYTPAINDADAYDMIHFDASDPGIRNDLHIGFGFAEGHDSNKWEFVIGGWGAGKSAIRSNNQAGVRNKCAYKKVF